MSGRRDVLDRIAAALERLAPPVAEPIDWSSHPAFLWDGSSAHPISQLDSVELGQLRGIDEQKSAVATNLARLASGVASHDMLLWGARGMGKSALVRAVVADLHNRQSGRLAVVQMTAGSLETLPSLIEALGQIDRAFLLFLDDLGFGDGETGDNLALRSLLDGGLVVRSANVRLAVTSNRRSIVGRSADESEAFHERDERDNSLALADRFGLTLGFHPCDQSTYLEIVRAYVDPLGLEFDHGEAVAWATERGNRSGRTAYQFACELAGRAGLSL